MLFKCLPEGAPIPGRFPGPVHARGKWFTIDIHCHVRNEQATQMVAGNQDVSRWFLETQASERSRGINRANGERTDRAERVARKTHRGHGPDGDRHSGDLAGAAPDLLRRRPRSRARDFARDQRFHRRDLRPSSRPLCRARHGAVPGARTGRRRARSPAQIAGLSRHRDHDPRRRRGSIGRALSQDFRALRRAGPLGVHALGRLHRGRALRRPLLRQCDRQPARHDGRIASPDLWRRVARLPEPEAGLRAWRRLSCRPIRAASTMPPRRAPMPANRSRGCRPPI